MNSNGQILSEVNEILNDIRARKERVRQLKSGLDSINGKTQDHSIFQFGRDLTVELSSYNSNYAGCRHEIHNHYKTAMVFIKRGINDEIEMHKKLIKEQECRLSGINLVSLSK